MVHVRFNLLKHIPSIDDKSYLDGEMKELTEGRSSNEDEVHKLRKRPRILDDDDEDKDDMISIQARKEIRRKKSFKKSAEMAAAEEMARNIIAFNDSPPACTACTELKYELERIKIEYEDVKAKLAAKNMELDDAKSANDAKRAVIKDLQSELQLSHTQDLKGKKLSQSWLMLNLC